MLRTSKLGLFALLATAAPVLGQPASSEPLADAAAIAQRQLRQTFTNLTFEDFGPAPVSGPIYQAVAGGRIIYFAPESEHLLFAAVYDKNGVNLTALAQDASARKRMGALDEADALVIGPKGAPRVIEFTDPDCPYCQALDRFWSTKDAEGKPVQRLIFFVSGIHPGAAAKAQHILCAADPASEFKAIYAGGRPSTLNKCKAGADKVARHAEAVRKMGISGTPTLLIGGKLISGFQQAELEAFLEAPKTSAPASP